MVIVSITGQYVLNVNISNTMTRSAILYNLNSVDLKLALLLRNNEELPDSELTEAFLKRYREYLFKICERCQELLQKYKV